MCDQQRFRQVCAYAQSDQSLCKSLEDYMTVKLLTDYYLEFLSLEGGCTSSSESTLVKMPGPAHEILVLIASASSEFSGDSAHARAFAARIHKVCTKMNNQTNI